MKEGTSELADSTFGKHVDPDNGQEILLPAEGGAVKA